MQGSPHVVCCILLCLVQALFSVSDEGHEGIISLLFFTFLMRSTLAVVLAKCPVSCGLCESTSEDVVDISDYGKCVVWARNGECERNPENMLRKCPNACGVGAVVCGDTAGYDSCQTWKKNGECEANPDAMAISCSATCGLCTRIERHYHGVASGSVHDEL